MAGRIVYIRLRNFMSYEDIELRPGPHLNLIVGPNGTGKSTFVCAVLVGLGGKLKLLGRADQVGSYVKNGRDEGTIDIELYDSEDDNVQITRRIQANNQSEFWINGKSASASKVNELRKKYNIYLENLCTFLPQERVQDFSALNPQQLLYQTQKTAGTEEMMAVYENLKELQKSRVDKEQSSTDLQKKIEIEKQKNERIKDKVKNYIEKQALNEKLTLINQKKSWLCYHNELQKMKEIANDYKMAEEQYDKRKKAFEKLVQDLKVLEGGFKKAEENFSKSKRDFAGKKSVIEEEVRKLRERIELLEDFDVRLESKLAEEESKKEELKQFEVNLNKLKNDLATFESKYGTDEKLQKDEKEILDELKVYHEKETNFTNTKAAFESELGRNKMHLQNAAAEYRLLERKGNARLDHIKRFHPDLYKCMEWVKQNRGLFRGPVYNPMMLEIDVTEPKYAKYLETRVAYRDLVSFTCTNSEDTNLLIKKLRVEQKFRLNIICSDSDDMSKYQPKVPLDQIRPLGFFAYLHELITGPKHIIRFLCEIYKMHWIPVGSAQVNTTCDQVPTTITIFYSDVHRFTTKASIYTGEKSIHVNKLKVPRFFSVPLEKKNIQQLQEKQKELAAAIQTIEMKLKLAIEEYRSTADKIDSISQKKSEIATLKEEKGHIIQRMQRTSQNIRKLQDSLRDPAEIRQEAEEKRNAVKGEIHRNFQNLAEACKNLEKCCYTMQECEIRFKASRLKMIKVEQQKSNGLEELRKFEETFNAVKLAKDRLQASCAHLKEAAKKLTNGISPGDPGFDRYETLFQKLKNTVEELETEFEETQVLADFLQGGNAEMVQEFEKREEVIANMETSLAERKKELNNAKSLVEALRDKWLVPINELVSTVNKSFESFFKSMGCVGEVKLIPGATQDDFEQYGIMINVKFRDEIPLQALGKHFQSGGERALTTAVYLLSLQKLMFVPFRFVDEINQGMDAENERRIMDLMMNVTAEDNSSQYFFITPKILPNVTTSDTTVIHCIYSGQIAINSRNWSLQNFLSKA